MADSVHNSGQVQSGNHSEVSTTGNTDGIALKEQVSKGFSPQNTSEIVKTADTIPLAGPLSIDEPPVETGGSESANTFVNNSKFSGLEAAVKLFSAIDLNSLDPADTSSILLLVKGAVSDMKALFGAEKIDTALGSLLTEYDQRVGRAKEVIQQKNDLEAKTQEKGQKIALKQEKEALLQQKQQELADAGGSDPVLEQEIAQLEEEISQLATDIEALNSAIVTLTSSISSNEAQLRNELQRNLKQLLPLVQDIKQRFDASAIKTGEDERAETAMANHELSIENARDLEKLRAAKSELKERFDELIDEQRKRGDEIDAQREMNQELVEFGRFTALAKLLGGEDVQALLDKGILDKAAQPLDKGALTSVTKTFEAILKVDLEGLQSANNEVQQTLRDLSSLIPQALGDSRQDMESANRLDDQDRESIGNSSRQMDQGAAELSQPIDSLALKVASSFLELQRGVLQIVVEDQLQKEQAEEAIRRSSKV